MAGYDPQSKATAVGPGATVNLDFSLGPKQLFSDGFESGSLSAWTTNSGLVIQGTIVHQDAYAAEASSAGGAAAYARENLPGAYSNVYARTYFFVRTLPVSTVNLIGDRTATGFSISRIYIDSQGRLDLRNDVAGTSTVGPAVSAGWHSVELHLVVNGTSSAIEVWLDGVAVGALTTQAANLGSVGVGQIQLGENQTGRSYDIAFDDVVVGTVRIGP